MLSVEGNGGYTRGVRCGRSSNLAGVTDVIYCLTSFLEQIHKNGVATNKSLLFTTLGSRLLFGLRLSLGLGLLLRFLLWCVKPSEQLTTGASFQKTQQHDHHTPLSKAWHRLRAIA